VLATRRRLARVVAVVLAQDARPCGDARLAPQLFALSALATLALSIMVLVQGKQAAA